MSAVDLLETLTDEPHRLEQDFEFIAYVEREHPNGDPIVVQVDVLVDWDGEPEPEVRYYARVPYTQDIGGGLSVNHGSFIMLTKQEIEDFSVSRGLDEIVKEVRDAQDHEEDSRRYYETSR